MYNTSKNTIKLLKLNQIPSLPNCSLFRSPNMRWKLATFGDNFLQFSSLSKRYFDTALYTELWMSLLTNPYMLY